MRNRKDSPVEKNFVSESEEVMSNSSCLNRIYKKVMNDGLSEEASVERAEDIKHICESFKILPKSAILLAYIMERNSRPCDDEDLADYLGCTNIEFLSFSDALDELVDNNIITANSNNRTTYTVTKEAVKAISGDCEFEPLKTVGLTNDDIFTRFRMLVSELRTDHISEIKFLSEIDKLIEGNQQLLFCKKAFESELYNSECTETERRIFYYLAHRYVSHGDSGVEVDTLMNLVEFMEDDARLKRYISNERTFIQMSGLIVFDNKDGFVNTDKLALSDAVKKEWFADMELICEEQNLDKNLILCDSIKEKELFYNDAEKEQIERLTSLLEEENFQKVRGRLEEEGMPKGFTVVFHGAPGSGKTASLYQIAKKTGRDIYFVDLSETKSKWVGESEKMTKQIFATYRKLARTRKKAPILAFNEADAVFNKRITNVENSAEQMLNAVTDIILNELETLDGILIATTNLIGNMMGGKDNAMERRFLFKVQFNTPSEEVRAKIWKSKLKHLSMEQCMTLAKKFELSGGNIDNIARKSTIEYVLSGEYPSLEKLMDYCEAETITKTKKVTRRVGFTA
ncbi:MAG: ATP-binding protein [Bacteroidales bacterium]|nr:ATP-binding protein [Bacteroidales bacterium]